MLLVRSSRSWLPHSPRLPDPFIRVGIIATIKETVVVAGAERPREEGWQRFTEATTEGGAASVVISPPEETT